MGSLKARWELRLKEAVKLTFCDQMMEFGLKKIVRIKPFSQTISRCH